MNLYHRAADMLERYGRVNGVMHCEVSMLIADLRAAAALDELVRENERLGLYDDQKPVAAGDRPLMLPPDKIRWTVGTDSRDGKPYLMDEDFTYDALWRCGGDFGSVETHAEYVREVCALLNTAPAPAQPRQPLSDMPADTVQVVTQAVWALAHASDKEPTYADAYAKLAALLPKLRAITGEKP